MKGAAFFSREPAVCNLEFWCRRQTGGGAEGGEERQVRERETEREGVRERKQGKKRRRQWVSTVK